MLCVDDAAVSSHTQQGLQTLINKSSQACEDFELTISLKKTNVLGQDTLAPLDNYELDVVKEFTYFGSIITENFFLDNEISKRIGKAATTMAHLANFVWKNTKLTVFTKMPVHNGRAVST